MLQTKDYVIISASDSKHAWYLVNALYSFRKIYANPPEIIIYDLGLNNNQVSEINNLGVKVRPLEHNCKHYFKNWTWKLDIIKKVDSEIVLYMDLPNFVILRKLDRFINLIKKNGYFFVTTGHKLGQQVPYQYWDLFNLDQNRFCDKLAFGAGLMGFNKSHPSYKGLLFGNELCLKGYNLGKSRDELNPRFSPELFRDCELFRADQTIINMSMRKFLGDELKIYNGKFIYAYDGNFSSDYGRKIHLDNQYLQYARRTYGSLVYLKFSDSKNIRIFLSKINFKLNALARYLIIKKIFPIQKKIIKEIKKFYQEFVYIYKYKKVMHIGKSRWIDFFVKSRSYPSSNYTKFGQEIIIFELIENYLDLGEKLSIIEVGCFMPIQNNISYFFEKYLNCDVIAVDLNIDLKNLWDQKRPKTTFLNFLISDKDGDEIVKIFDINSKYGCLSSAMNSSIHNSKIATIPKKIITRRIKRLSINTLMDLYKNQSNQILIIDTEGYELVVLKGLGDMISKVSIILFEHHYDNMIIKNRKNACTNQETTTTPNAFHKLS